MNYTENYHLPQWEETDRIMRTDFNAAMASLEGGLTECRDAAAAGSVQAGSALYAGLFRLAYNHWRLAGQWQRGIGYKAHYTNTEQRRQDIHHSGKQRLNKRLLYSALRRASDRHNGSDPLYGIQRQCHHAVQL